MQVKHLEHISFSALMTCFLKAFENYFVKMPTDHKYYETRWKMANVRLDLSYGMFDNNKLVGFVIHAIDQRHKHLIAFNTGTGVLPEYRGQHIVRSIYQYAIPKLKNAGITKCQLEVIKDNIRAVKAYEGIGFKINKSYKCFSGAITLAIQASDYELKQVNKNDLNWDELNQGAYSWDNHFNTITKGKYAYYVILVNNVVESYFVIDSGSGYIAQFNTLTKSKNNWVRLFSGIEHISKTVKINNVDEVLIEKINALNDFGLKNTIDQYEMELLL